MNNQVASIHVADHVTSAEDTHAVCLLLRNSYMSIAQARELAHELARAADDAELKLPQERT
jgi:hypothetical protein